MSTITIPRELTKKGALIVIPREEYEELLNFRSRIVKEVPLTSQQKQLLARARKNLTRGNFLTPYELKRKFGIKN